jgi:DNA-binding winged helix-turn-helix (wHTH) protein
MRYAFEGCELDTDAYELYRDARPVRLEPQVLEVLRYLVQHADRVVPKTELLDNVWGDRFVSESALTSRIKASPTASAASRPCSICRGLDWQPRSETCS